MRAPFYRGRHYQEKRPALGAPAIFRHCQAGVNTQNGKILLKPQYINLKKAPDNLTIRFEKHYFYLEKKNLDIHDSTISPLVKVEQSHI